MTNLDARTIEIVADEAIATFHKKLTDVGYLPTCLPLSFEIRRFHVDAISMTVVTMGKTVISTPASRKAADEKEEAEHRLDLLNSVVFNAKDYLSDLSMTSLSNLEAAIKKVEQHNDAQLTSEA